MAQLDSPAGILPHIPDNLTLAQFILDSQHPSRPVRKHGIPWFIEDHTGRTLGYEEVRSQLLFSTNIHLPIHHSDTRTSFWLSKRTKAHVRH